MSHVTRPIASSYGIGAGATARIASTRLRIRQGAVKCLGVLLIVLFLVGTSWPTVFKHPAGFALFAMILTAMVAGPPSDSGSRARTRVLIASLVFVTFGAAILLLSMMRVFAIGPTLPVRNDYILRQAYFVFLWIPFLLGAVSFWSALGPAIIAVCRRWALPLLVMMALWDLASARLAGNLSQIAWSGYYSFLDKFGLQFVFSLIYLFYVAHTRHWILCLALITVYAAASKLLHAGVMFNATTGAIFYLFLVTSTIPLVSRRLQACGVTLIYLALIAFLVLGMLVPDLFNQDRNNEWRLMAWRANLDALWTSGLAGVGFGTPYFPLISGNILNTLDNQWNSVSANMVNPIDPQYVRAQHSSIVNMFYRLGLVGGVLFIWLNLLIARIGFAGLRHPDPAVARLAYAAFVLFVVQAVQMTVHVGLETPIFLSIYMLSTALVLHVNSLAAKTLPVKALRPTHG
jgi:hypothetical protein